MGAPTLRPRTDCWNSISISIAGPSGSAMASSRVAFKANTVFGLAGTVFSPPNFFGVAKAMPPAMTDDREPGLTENPSALNDRFTPMAFQKQIGRTHV